MDDNVAYIYKDYRMEFSGDGVSIYGEAFHPSERLPIGRVNGHSYNSKDRNDKSHRKDNSLHIDLLIVSEAHNGKGVGTTLMKMLMLYVEKKKYKHVTTSPSPINGRSQKELEKFYRRFHFSTGIMVKKIEFVDDDDLLLMEQEEAGSEEFETEKIKNLNHEVEKAVSTQTNNSYLEDDYFSEIKPIAEEEVEEEVSTEELKENIQAALKLLGEEEHKIEEQQAMLDEISAITKMEDDVLESHNKETGYMEEEQQEEKNVQFSHIENSQNIGILTIIYYVEEKLPRSSKILDVNSRFVAQKAYFEQKGHKVISVDSIDLRQFEEDSFDVILAIEPMDELKTKGEQVAFLKDAYRVCKPNGRIFVSFTSNDMMLANEILNYDPDFLRSENVDKRTMKILHGSRTTFDVSEMEDVIASSGMTFTKRFAMDGIAALMKDQLDAMNERQFNKWMSYHLYTCEKEHIIGYSTSIVYIIQKTK